MDIFTAKKLLVVSDSHGKSENIGRAVSLNTDLDMIIHLGDGASDLTLSLPPNYDKPILTVEGNCDYIGFYPIDRRYLPRVLRIVSINGKRVYLCHGHNQHVKGGLGALALAAYSAGADIALFGHTHKKHIEYIPKGTSLGQVTTERPLLLFNPGSISMGHPPSFGLLSFSGDDVLPSHGEIK